MHCGHVVMFLSLPFRLHHWSEARVQRFVQPLTSQFKEKRLLHIHSLTVFRPFWPCEHWDAGTAWGRRMRPVTAAFRILYGWVKKNNQRLYCPYLHMNVRAFKVSYIILTETEDYFSNRNQRKVKKSICNIYIYNFIYNFSKSLCTHRAFTDR